MEGFDDKGNLKEIQIYPKKSKAMNLAFDVTPAKYVTGLITEKGICDASTEGLKKLYK
jgi:methylthioribose-1-phosphate isomerase